MKQDSILGRAWKFVSEDIWDVDVRSITGIKSVGIKAVRVIHLVFKGFKEDQCPLHASALTYSTLMSIVPVLAVSLSLATAFGAGKTVKEKFRSTVENYAESLAVHSGRTNAVDTIEDPNLRQEDAPTEFVAGLENGAAGTDVEDSTPEVLPPDKMILDLFEKVFGYVENINVAAIGGVGLALLLLTVVMVLGKVESSFNKVWGVTKGRPLHRKFFDYLGVLILMPILIVASSSLSIADILTSNMPTGVATTLRAILDSGVVKELTSLLLVTVTFTFLIMFMPNTRVGFVAGIIGGFVAALGFVIWLWFCAKGQIGLAKYSAMYASFAAVPIVLFWVFISWEIILFGAETAFAVQNCATYHMETRVHAANSKAKLSLALAIVGEAARSMQDRHVDHFDAAMYSRDHGVPVRLINEVITRLVDADVMSELAGQTGVYTLLAAPDSIPAKDIVDVVLDTGVGPEDLGLQGLSRKVTETMEKADLGMESALRSLTVKDLIS